jgi:hypothetical protein
MTMPPHNQILRELDQNARRGPNLTIAQRNYIISMLAGGYTTKEVVAAYSRTKRCIRNF